jgi:hypothetical protein
VVRMADVWLYTPHRPNWCPVRQSTNVSGMCLNANC